MTPFSALLAGMTHDGDVWHSRVSEDWRQGRTTYGGLSAALCLQAALKTVPDLPPLRSAQLGFIGPAMGELTLRPRVLRQGKSAVYVGVDCHGEQGLATQALFCFGATRASAFTHRALEAPAVPAPDKAERFFADERQPTFFQHFEPRLAADQRPFARNGPPTMTLWLRHRDIGTRDVAGADMAVAVLALADAPPPAAIVMFEEFFPISTMTWHLDVLTDDLVTQDGWWLLRTRAETAADGYSAQAMTLWNAQGRPVIAARQTIAVFG